MQYHFFFFRSVSGSIVSRCRTDRIQLAQVKNVWRRRRKKWKKNLIMSTMEKLINSIRFDGATVASQREQSVERLSECIFIVCISQQSNCKQYVSLILAVFFRNNRDLHLCATTKISRKIANTFQLDDHFVGLLMKFSVEIQ